MVRFFIEHLTDASLPRHAGHVEIVDAIIPQLQQSGLMRIKVHESAPLPPVIPIQKLLARIRWDPEFGRGRFESRPSVEGLQGSERKALR